MAGGGASNLPPIVIKKGKHHEHEFHGGHWKVALADFMTSMFIIFLMLWLVNQVTPSQRQGIADYFSPQSVSRQTTGSGSILGGQTITVPGASVSPSSPIGVVGQGLPAPTPGIGEGKEETEGFAGRRVEREVADANAEAAQEAQFVAVERQLKEVIRQVTVSNPELGGIAENLQVERSDEGITIQITDSERTELFASGSATPRAATSELLRKVADIVKAMPEKKIRVSGHTDSRPFPAGSARTNWELSADRANAARRTLAQFGVSDAQIASVSGRADREPLDAGNPDSPRNRRISVVLLNDPQPPQPQRPQQSSAGESSGVPADSRAEAGQGFPAQPQRPAGATAVSAGPAPEGPLIRR